MVERIEGLPSGVLGFRLTGKLHRDEYHDELMEPIYAALERGEKLDILCEMPEDFDGLDLGALWEDTKAAGSIGLKHRPPWHRFAIVTNKDWIRHSASVFGWITPGEMKVFDLGDTETAVQWLTETSAP